MALSHNEDLRVEIARAIDRPSWDYRDILYDRIDHWRSRPDPLKFADRYEAQAERIVRSSLRRADIVLGIVEKEVEHDQDREVLRSRVRATGG